MNIIENPPEKQLNYLQTVLNNEKALRNTGIFDIFATINPFYLVAEDADSAVGVASLNVTPDVVEIYKLYVAPSHRRKGIGEALFNRVLDIAKKSGFDELFIEVVGGSEPFWQSILSKYEHFGCGDGKYFISINE